MYCSKCGKQLEKRFAFCPVCGQPVYAKATATICDPVLAEPAWERVLRSLSKRELASAILWVSIACLQIFIALQLHSWLICFVAMWNIVAAYTHYNQSKLVLQPCFSLVSIYQKQLKVIIAFLAINLSFGAWIGVASAIYDLTVRNYVLKNKAILPSVCQQELTELNKAQEIDPLKL